jgi:hypothetical protein
VRSSGRPELVFAACLTAGRNLHFRVMTDWLLPWLQLFVNSLAAFLIFLYLVETYRLRVASRDQVSESRRLVALSEAQLEAQIRPAVVARVQDPNGQKSIEVLNIGKGAALDVRLSAVPLGSVEQWDGKVSEFERQWSLSYLAPSGKSETTSVRTRPVPGLGGVPVLGKQSFRCEYRSLSGRTYSTIVEFDDNGVTVVSTQFSRLPDFA